MAIVELVETRMDEDDRAQPVVARQRAEAIDSTFELGPCPGILEVVVQHLLLVGREARRPAHEQEHDAWRDRAP